MTYSPRLHTTCPGKDFYQNACNCCCPGCVHSCTLHTDDHSRCTKPRRTWFTEGWDSPWWKPMVFAGIRGGDEWCNRTVGLRVPGGAVFLNLDFPMRTESCDECVAVYLPEEKEKT